MDSERIRRQLGTCFRRSPPADEANSEPSRRVEANPRAPLPPLCHHKSDVILPETFFSMTRLDRTSPWRSRRSRSSSTPTTSSEDRRRRSTRSRSSLIIVGEYVDRLTGSKASHPALNQLMADASQRKFDAVLVWKVDRFGRSLQHMINVLVELEALGLTFISLRG
jgi:hypothetical protein